MATHTSKLTASDILVTTRPFRWIVTVAPFVVGYFATRGFELGWPLYVGVLYFAVGYNLLLYGLNDMFAHRPDVHQPRAGGIGAVALAKSKHRALWVVVAALNVPFLLYFIVVGQPNATVWLLGMLFMVVAYSVRGLRYKEVPGLDAFTSAFQYTSPFIFGVLLAGGDNFWIPAFLTFFIWAMANYALGVIQDIAPDRQAKIDSIATKLGAENTLLVCLGSYLVAAIVPVAYYGWKGAFVSVVLCWYVALCLSLIPFRQHDEHHNFRKAWRVLTIMNYVTGTLIALYLLLLHHW